MVKDTSKLTVKFKKRKSLRPTTDKHTCNAELVIGVK